MELSLHRSVIWELVCRFARRSRMQVAGAIAVAYPVSSTYVYRLLITFGDDLPKVQWVLNMGIPLTGLAFINPDWRPPWQPTLHWERVRLMAQARAAVLALLEGTPRQRGDDESTET